MLNQIAESYPNLKYLNLEKNKYVSSHVEIITDKGLFALANACRKLEYLNISYHIEITRTSISKCYNISKEAVDQLNRNIHVENFVMPPDFIGIVSNHLTLASLAQMRKQHRVGERILAPEWVFTLPI
ncbi:hypothetical protein RhiirA1_479304 [Rhizophagus irregularis]|uniref:Uncharacterized protein n=1 Tax=Rhizophagus irregularis TaxID=588596 RepID=A0A2N0QQV6_9GLOM|nr:hypothetical protein RhiirA1_479304 [Rhizophagus irregularis]